MPIVNVTDIFASEAKSTLPVDQTVDALIEGYPCIAFSKSYCPYNSAVKDLLAFKYGVLLLVIDINQAGGDSSKLMQQHLHSKTGIATVPQVFVDGQFLGNHDSIMELHAKGLLRDRLGQHAKFNGCVPPNNTTTMTANTGIYTPLFWFPPTINKWAIRATGMLSCMISTALAYAMFAEGGSKSTVVDWLATLLFADFLLRFFSGSQMAPIAKMGAKLADASSLTPIPRPGAPKQFASLCGMLFSGLGALCYSKFNSSVAGGVFLAILAVCTGMEGGLDFCMGCKFFAIAERVLADTAGNKRSGSESKSCEKKTTVIGGRAMAA